MSGPFIFIATNRLKPGKLADERKRVRGLVDFVDANEQRLIAAAYAETVAATTSIQVFGRPSNAILEMLERQAGAGVPLTVKSFHLGGFTR